MYIDSFNTTRVLSTPPEKIELNELETKKKDKIKPTFASRDCQILNALLNIENY